jgi:uncharacterized protein involved in oxidation of intracellular sulfur
MKLAIIISITEPETIWNAFRVANLAVDAGDAVSIFLIGAGVEYEKASNAKFNIAEQVQKFLQSEKAHILACGACLKLRQQESSETCPISTLKDLYNLIRDSNKVLSF